MVDAILKEVRQSSFDFRAFVAPCDSLSARFEEWVPYYRLKHCIAKVLQPKSILEIGVRYGYSARTFLEASPSAKFLGIDLDCEAFGGEKGALDWARHITASFDASYLVADSQQMETLPGGIYDLVHVDGQQDGYGTFHDLRRAISQARWVLLDGYFWTSANFLNANDFLLKFKHVISYAFTIPGYAGELLIRTSDQYLAGSQETPSGNAKAGDSTSKIRLTTNRFAGTAEYGSFCGRDLQQLDDVKLLSLLALSQLTPPGNALVIGSAPPELTRQLTASGRDVTAIDCSTASTKTLNSGFSGEGEQIADSVQLLCRDIMELELPGNFNFAVAAGVIEYLTEDQLTTLLKRLAAHLEIDGVLAIHSCPNLWYYKKFYPRLRSRVEKLGGFLAAEPRSYHELMLHLHERSPVALRKTLNTAFRYVQVWVAGPESPGECLSGRRSIEKLIGGRDIYALASHSPLNLKLAERLLTQPKLQESSYTKIHIVADDYPEKVGCGGQFRVLATVRNDSGESLASLLPHPVHLSYHWFTAGTAEAVVFDGLRTKLPRLLGAQEECTVGMRVEAPCNPGLYDCEIMAVQENCRWFGGCARRSIPVV